MEYYLLLGPLLLLANKVRLAEEGRTKHINNKKTYAAHQIGSGLVDRKVSEPGLAASNLHLTERRIHLPG